MYMFVLHISDYNCLNRPVGLYRKKSIIQVRLSKTYYKNIVIIILNLVFNQFITLCIIPTASCFQNWLSHGACSPVRGQTFFCDTILNSTKKYICFRNILWTHSNTSFTFHLGRCC